MDSFNTPYSHCCAKSQHGKRRRFDLTPHMAGLMPSSVYDDSRLTYLNRTGQRDLESGLRHLQFILSHRELVPLPIDIILLRSHKAHYCCWERRHAETNLVSSFQMAFTSSGGYITKVLEATKRYFLLAALQFGSARGSFKAYLRSPSCPSDRNKDRLRRASHDSVKKLICALQTYSRWQSTMDTDDFVFEDRMMIKDHVQLPEHVTLDSACREALLNIWLTVNLQDTAISRLLAREVFPIQYYPSEHELLCRCRDKLEDQESKETTLKLVHDALFRQDLNSPSKPWHLVNNA